VPEPERLASDSRRHENSATRHHVAINIGNESVDMDFPRVNLGRIENPYLMRFGLWNAGRREMRGDERGVIGRRSSHRHWLAAALFD